jgi:hypothetical protein
MKSNMGHAAVQTAEKGVKSLGAIWAKFKNEQPETFPHV